MAYRDSRRAFKGICGKHLAFLLTEFSFHLAKAETSTNGCVLLYLSQSTGLDAVLSALDQRISFYLYRLVDGQMPKYVIASVPATEVTVFDVDIVIEVRGGMPVRYTAEDLYDAARLEVIVGEYAGFLREKCRDILSGDFSNVSAIESAILARVVSSDKQVDESVAKR